MIKKKYWIGDVPRIDTFEGPITNIFYDGKTRIGSWAIMNPDSWEIHGAGVTGIGLAQLYVKQEDGRWLKIEG